MNLKEAFRYQNFLERTMMQLRTELCSPDTAFTITKTHKRKEAYSAVEDITEVVDRTGKYDPDVLLRAVTVILAERTDICAAIAHAKANMKDSEGKAFDLDAALDTVKFQRTAIEGVRGMLLRKARTVMQEGTAYAFNAEGNQVPYVYTVEVAYAENYNRKAVQEKLRNLTSTADALSAKIELAQVTTQVLFTPMFDINDDFDDVIQNIMNAE